MTRQLHWHLVWTVVTQVLVLVVAMATRAVAGWAATALVVSSLLLGYHAARDSHSRRTQERL